MIAPDATKFPARFLFKATAFGMANHELEFEGHSGTRLASACTGGQVDGEGFKGTIVDGQSNEWKLVSPKNPGQFGVEGLLLLHLEGGEVVLMKYVGRGSDRYGPNSYRINVAFEASEGPLEWLNEITSVAYVTVDGLDLHFEVHQLLSKATEGCGFLDVEPIYALTMNGVIGDRFKINGLIHGRYCSVAGASCTTEGKLTSNWLKGFVSGAHRTSRTPSTFPWQLDYRVGMKSDDGVSILKFCVGAIPRSHVSPDADADRSWQTSAVYETQAEGPMSWLNGIVSVGTGRPEDGQVKHWYYILL